MSSIMGKTVDVVNKTTPAAESSPADVLELVHVVMHLYRSQQFRGQRGVAAAAADAEPGVSHMESKVLGFFARHPGATQRDLVEHARRDKGQLARLIGGLKERGLLEASADPDDRRSIRLHLTETGQAANQALRRQGRRLATAAVKGLSEAERAQLVQLLGRVRANLEDAAGGD
jgi:DNA-binding MarR family transcriptional regulator